MAIRGVRGWLHNVFFFFFNDTATTEIYTLSLHDALPICYVEQQWQSWLKWWLPEEQLHRWRSEEHTSELQSPCNLVCRLLLEKKKEVHRARHDDYSRLPRCRRLRSVLVHLGQ